MPFIYYISGKNKTEIRWYYGCLMRNAGLEEAQAGIKIAGRNITSDMQMTQPLWQKVKKN